MTLTIFVTAGALFLSAAPSQSPPLQSPGAPGQPTGTVSVDQSVAMSRTQHTEDDVRFMQHMIVHHAQAVEMNALIAARSDSRAVRRLGARIAQTQSSEMEMMRRWLSERGEPTRDSHLGHAGHAHHAAMPHDHAADPDDVPLMPGMLSPNQMRALEAAQGQAFDRLFLEGMIHHHQGALDMVDQLLADPGNGEDTQLSEFLTHVTADQAAEILRMQSMLSAMTPPHGDPEESRRP